jgi:hypothetical protein
MCKMNKFDKYWGKVNKILVLRLYGLRLNLEGVKWTLFKY